MKDKEIQRLIPYKGTEPYIFISYAHKDSAKVQNVICGLQNKGYRVWLDTGVEVGTEWANNIAEHLKNCTVFVAFISQNSMMSEHCLDEIAYAKAHKKESLMVFLEDEVILPEGTEMQTARFQRMYFNRHKDMESFLNEFSTVPVFEACKGEGRIDTAVKTGEEDLISKNKGSFFKNKKLLAGISVVAILGVIMAAFITLFNPLTEEGKNSFKTETVQMSEDLYDYTFKLEGKVYKLPFAFEQLTEAGWVITESGVTNETSLRALDYEYVRVMKEGKSIRVVLYNDCGNKIKIGDSKVGAISVDDEAGDIFEIAKGINLGNSVEEIEAAFGKPTDKSIYDEYERLMYRENDDYNTGVEIYCNKNSDSYSYAEITVTNIQIGTGNSEDTNEAVPEYLSSYTAPEGMSDDLMSGVVKLEGKIYQLPVPLQMLLDDGWMISSGASFVASEHSKTIDISKDVRNLSVDVFNYADYQTIPENCAVIGINDGSDDGIFELPGQLKVGLTKEELEQILDSRFEKEEYTYSIVYHYYEYEDKNIPGSRDYRIYCNVDKESNEVDYISIENKQWKQ